MRLSTRSLPSKPEQSAPVMKFRIEKDERSNNHEHETRSDDNPCFRCRRREKVLRETGVPIRRRLRERKLAGHTIYSSWFRGIDHFWNGCHASRAWPDGFGPS